MRIIILFILFAFNLNAQVEFVIPTEKGDIEAIMLSKENWSKVEKLISDIESPFSKMIKEIEGPNAKSTITGKFKIKEWKAFADHYKINIDGLRKENDICNRIIDSWNKNPQEYNISYTQSKPNYTYLGIIIFLLIIGLIYKT